MPRSPTDRIEECHALGIEHFVLSGYPRLEEAYWFGEGVMPELAVRGPLPRVPASGAPLLAASGRQALSGRSPGRSRPSAKLVEA